ncbi:MAG: hypothetical protein JNK72_06705 [Myxococcales bacterium]|nr:hypothetical protein [Myxococcales bacterium]
MKQEATTWLVISLALFFFGLGFITGPLAWWKGAQLSPRFDANRMNPNLGQYLKVSGIVLTVLNLLGFLAVVLVVVGIWASGSRGY